MNGVTREIVIEQLQELLREGMEGPKPGGSWFTDTAPDSGLLGSIAELEARQASRPWGGTSIAAHVHHVAFSLDVSAAWIRGERPQTDWKESWTVSEVDDDAWRKLVRDLRSRYERLQSTIALHAWDSDTSMAGSIGVIAHVACHLGAIRQKLAFSRS